MKAYNLKTGRWFVKGKGFVASPRSCGDELSAQEVVVVKASYENVGTCRLQPFYSRCATATPAKTEVTCHEV